MDDPSDERLAQYPQVWQALDGLAVGGGSGRGIGVDRLDPEPEQRECLVQCGDAAGVRPVDVGSIAILAEDLEQHVASGFAEGESEDRRGVAADGERCEISPRRAGTSLVRLRAWPRLVVMPQRLAAESGPLTPVPAE